MIFHHWCRYNIFLLNIVIAILPLTLGSCGTIPGYAGGTRVSTSVEFSVVDGVLRIRCTGVASVCECYVGIVAD